MPTPMPEYVKAMFTRMAPPTDEPDDFEAERQRQQAAIAEWVRQQEHAA